MEDDRYLKGDKLILRGLKFHGFHGVKPEERTLGQKFVIDVDAWMDLRPAGLSDDLSDTVSYTAIYRIVKEVVEGEPNNLLESVAHKIACNTFTNFSRISAIRIQVGKPHIAVHGQLDYLGVEIFRKRTTCPELKYDNVDTVICADACLNDGKPVDFTTRVYNKLTMNQFPSSKCEFAIVST